jgi:hypothetical protein
MKSSTTPASRNLGGKVQSKLTLVDEDFTTMANGLLPFFDLFLTVYVINIYLV